jgi:3-phosphoglycerate kinase
MNLDGIRWLEALEPAGRHVLLRTDFDVPLESGRVADDLRLQRSLPTVDALRARGAKVVIMSHLGRPGGRVDERLRLTPVVERLGQLLEAPVTATADVVGDDATAKVAAMAAGEIVVLENLRFERGETAGDEELAKRLAGLGQAYVNDAFAVSHRAHTSVVGVPGLMPDIAGGEALRGELEALARVIESPPRPFTVIIGGAKVADKLKVIEHLLERVDRLLIGGAMSFTFLAANGFAVGASRVEPDQLDAVNALLERARQLGVELLLPVDVIAAEAFEADAESKRVSADGVPEGWIGLDVGPRTVSRYAERIADAGAVLWNGPMGVFEWPAFAGGTEGIAHAVADCAGLTVIGGGDSAAAIDKLGLLEAVDHLSTGGGASLALLEGQELPGVAALRRGSGEAAARSADGIG